MIAVARTPIPTILKNNEKRWLEALQHAVQELAALEQDPAASKKQLEQARQRRRKAEEKYNHPEIKRALVEMFHGKCAYCESQVRIVAYGDIEHFCPKSHPSCLDYTFSWSNLLLSCSICNNRSHKSNQHYTDVNGNILLINPTDPNVNPNNHLRFHWDEIAGIASIYGADEKGKTTVHVFDLNGLRGRKELFYERSGYVKRLFALLKLAQQEDRIAKSLLEEACQPQAPYAAFALYYIAPALLTLPEPK